jgi:hypothetical protein
MGKMGESFFSIQPRPEENDFVGHQTGGIAAGMPFQYREKNMAWVSKAGPARIISLTILCVFFASCSGKGLLTPPQPDLGKGGFLQLIPDSSYPNNPRFLVVGDTQIGWRAKEAFLKKKNWLTWKMLIFPFYQIYWLGNGIVGGINVIRGAPDYGWKPFYSIRDYIQSYIRKENFDFLLSVGDLVADGRRPEQWRNFFSAYLGELPILKSIPFVAVRGNHDRTLDPRFGGPNYQTLLNYPSFFTLNYPDITIFMLDSQRILDDYQNIDDETQNEWFQEWFVSDDPLNRPSWLEKNLNRCGTKFKIVVMHHPPISFGKHFYDWKNPSYGSHLEEKRIRLLRLLQRHQVQLILSGHEHFYEHSRLLPQDDTSQTDMHIIVSGSGGAPVRDFLSDQDIGIALNDLYNQGLRVELIRHDQIYNIIQIDCSDQKLVFRVLEVTTNPDDRGRQVEVFEIR